MRTLVLLVDPVLAVVAALAVGTRTDGLVVGIVSLENPVHLLEEHDVVLIDFCLALLLQLHALGVGLGERSIGSVGFGLLGLLSGCECTLMVMRFL